jgi:ADP-glucose pyrophosphorylase
MHTLAMVLASEMGTHLLVCTARRTQPDALLAYMHRVIDFSFPICAGPGALHQDQR